MQAIFVVFNVLLLYTPYCY